MDRNRKHITGCQGLGWRGRGGLEAPMARVKVKLTISSDFKIYDFKICNHQWGNWKVFNSCQVCALAKYTTLFLVKDRIPPSPHHKRKKQKKWVTTLRFSFHVYLHVTDFFYLFLNINLFILIGGQLLYNIGLVLPYINMLMCDWHFI